MSNVNLEIQTKLESLQQALLESHPQMPTLLRDIHSTLKAQPEQVTLLTEDQIHLIIQGLEKQTGVHLAQATTKTTKSKTAALKSATLDDLF